MEELFVFVWEKFKRKKKCYDDMTTLANTVFYV